MDESRNTPSANQSNSDKDSFKKAKPAMADSDSSSESDLDDYLQPADEIDLDSEFFQTHKIEKQFEALENKIFAGVDRLSDSDSEIEEAKKTDEQLTPTLTARLNFQQLNNYTSKIEEAKKLVEKYEARKKAKLAKNKSKRPANDLSVSDLLAVGESNAQPSVYCDSDSEKEWEEVEEGKAEKNVIPKDGVQFTVQLPGGPPQKKQPDLLAMMKRRLNKIKRDNQVFVHKVHLLCWIAHGNYINKTLNSESILALALSLIPSQNCYPPDRTDLTYLEQVVKWYKDAVPVIDKVQSKMSLEKLLKIQIARKQAYNKVMKVYIFICILRSLGIQCRLILSFRVEPLRPPANELHSVRNENQDNRNLLEKSKGKKKKPSEGRPSKKPDGSNQAKISEKQLKPDKVNLQKLEINKGRGSITSKPNLKAIQSKSKLKAVQNNTPRSSTAKSSTSDPHPVKKKVEKLHIMQTDGANDSDSETSLPQKKPNLKKLKVIHKSEKKSKKTHNKIQTSSKFERLKPSSEFERSNPSTSRPFNSILQTSRSFFGGPNDVRNDIIGLIKNQMAKERVVACTKLAKSKRKAFKEADYDSDYAPETVKKKHIDSDDEFYENNKVKVKRRVKSRKEAENDETKVKKGMDVWVEVYLEGEEKWISADVTKGRLHCIKEIYMKTSHPVAYIVAWSNDNSIKDITQRYCSNWNTVTRKLRVDKNWWQATLRPYQGRKTARDKEEDEELARLQLEQPLPTSVAEYKNHPLYVLKKHLLKFEAFYPPDPITLGFFKGEAVYSRDCVHVLHSREVWIKYAKVVKAGEEPYKITKARAKYDKLSGQAITDKPLELFGKWQVEDYVPPTAENGIVPRNCYGNVDLFKASMLPKGTVHLQLPGLNKLAKRMNFDCAPAVVGFDFHAGGSHPTFDGFVVCEEHSESLIAAWYMEREEQEKKEKEKREKRIYDNWKKLIKGLLIKERLKARYNFGEPSKRKKGPKQNSKKRKICSGSESD